MENLKFTKELKENWLSALKSGKYIQGAGQLRKGNSFCCLGVLCDIHPMLSISEDGYSDLFNGECHKNNWHWLRELLPLDSANFNNLWGENDSNCDGKYTAVIPLIEEIPTI